MPQKRRTNTAKGGTANTRRNNARKTPAKAGVQAAKAEKAPKGQQAQEAPRIMRASVQNDLVGMLIAVVAIALLVSLVTPSGAVVTHAVERALTLCFGVGAILCPVMLFLYSLTFFVEGEEPFGSHAALGLVLVSLSVLSLISLFAPGAEEAPGIVLEQSVAEARGGYVGGGVAWLMLAMLGKNVGLVLLLGLALLGFIVCGFSVTGFALRVRQGVQHVHESRVAAREERVASGAAPFGRSIFLPLRRPVPVGAYDVDPAEEGQASFIGGRRTSVLTRARRRPAKDAPPDDEFEDYEDYDDYEDFDEEGDGRASGRGATGTATRLLGTRRGGKRRKMSAWLEQRLEDASEDAEGTPAASEDAAGAAPADAAPEKAAKTRLSRTASRRRGGTGAKGKAAGKGKAQGATKGKAAQAASAQAASPRPGEGDEQYALPPLDMLESNPMSAGSASSQEELEETMDRLQATLREFGLTSRVVDYVSGPIVTTFRIDMGEGERVNRIRNLEDDIALNLAAEKVRIFAPVPGTSFVGIEIPNKTRQKVQLGDVLPHASGGPLEVAIGRDSGGRPVVADIAKMPHMLVAGTTGSGKSVMINSMIMSLLMRTTPKQVRLIMIDPKRVEFSCYNGLPHLYVPVVTEPRQAASALQWAVSEMERRLKLFERAGAREIKAYNGMCESGKFEGSEQSFEPLPYLVVVIDELSDLMMVAGKDVEASIVRIAQLARAAGIHLVIATQRPSANVVTGLIKSNIDNRVALKVATGVDSRVILDEVGAERLLGNGDMLFKYKGLNMRRVLGCYTSDDEINAVVDFIRSQAEPDYHEEILSAVVPGQPGMPLQGSADDDDDPLVWEAAQIVVESRLGSTSGLQRRLKVGYARAGRIMDMLESKGVVGPPDGSKPREVLLDEDGLEELRTQEAAYRGVM